MKYNSLTWYDINVEKTTSVISTLLITAINNQAVEQRVIIR